jgi:hypothetical protein
MWFFVATMQAFMAKKRQEQKQKEQKELLERKAAARRLKTVKTLADQQREVGFCCLFAPGRTCYRHLCESRETRYAMHAVKD